VNDLSQHVSNSASRRDPLNPLNWVHLGGSLMGTEEAGQYDAENCWFIGAKK
jgi:hypothetical protein